MRNVHPLFVAVLALAILSVDAALALATYGQQFPHPAAVGLLAFGLAQLGLLAAWLAAGPGKIVIRVSLSLLAMVGFSWLLSYTTHPDFAQWLGVLGLYVTFVAVPAFVFRWIVVGRPVSGAGSDPSAAGGPADSEHSTAVDRPARSAPSERRRSRPQWTLAGIMSLMTVTAVALSYSRIVDFPWADAIQVVLTCIGFALTTLLALFIARGIKWFFWHVPAVVLTCPVIGAVVGLILGPASVVGVMAVVALIQSLVVVLLVDLFRMPQRVPPRSI